MARIKDKLINIHDRIVIWHMRRKMKEDAKKTVDFYKRFDFAPLAGAELDHIAFERGLIERPIGMTDLDYRDILATLIRYQTRDISVIVSDKKARIDEIRRQESNLLNERIRLRNQIYMLNKEHI